MSTIHPQAINESDSVGAGTRVWAFAHLMKGATIGRDCNLGEHVFVEKDVRVGERVTVKNGVSLWTGLEVGDEVFIGPAAVFTNVKFPRAFIKTPPTEFARTRIHRGATVGAGAVIVCGISIGEYAFIGAGAVVTRDVPAHALILGNPGKIRGFVCKCGQTRVAADARQLACKACGTTVGLC